jgi:glycosyltransferase involved in cell wall biosynthesis
VQKDQATLLRAFARVRARRPARLLILGEGNQRLALEALARELGIAADVRMPGFVPNPLAYMRRAAVFVLSSAWEGLPTVLIEALACGCPVVSTDCPAGPAEILDYGRYGRLTPVGDVEALAAAITASVEDGPDRTALEQRALAFSAERAAVAYIGLLLLPDFAHESHAV